MRGSKTRIGRESKTIQKAEHAQVARACCFRNYRVIDFQPNGQEEESAQEETRGKKKARA